MARTMTERSQGTVVKVVPDKGWGFIKGRDGQEYFFHRSQTVDFEGYHQGLEVTFVPTPGQGTKGPRAEAVEVA